LNNPIEIRGDELLFEAEALLAHREIEDALIRYDAAERLGASADRCAAGRWHCWMLMGKFARAWEESDAIRNRGAIDPHRYWDGSTLTEKRVMLRCLHGYGDAIQFLRYVPFLRRQAAYLTVEVAPALVPLVSLLPGIDRVVSWEDPLGPEWDLEIELMELPYLFRSTLDNLPASHGYLHLPDELIERSRAMMGHAVKPRVGIAWAAGEWNRSRSIAFEWLLPLLSCDSVSFWSLQGGEENAVWMNARHHYGLNDSADLGAGLIPLSGVIANLDLVISVDTMAAHLSGAMGIPTFLLLQRAADWRWMIDRSDSPWYPSMRIFRQLTDGDWPELLSRLKRELMQWGRSPSRSQALTTQ
jgi:hypothetical protein